MNRCRRNRYSSTRGASSLPVSATASACVTDGGIAVSITRTRYGVPFTFAKTVGVPTNIGIETGGGTDQVTVGAVVTAVKRQISKKTGKEYARLVLEDFHGTAEAIVFPDAWAKLNQTIFQDAALLLTGGYSDRDRGEDQAPFIVELARPLEELKTSGALALSLSWRAPSAPQPAAVKEVAALCSAHPGPTPLYIEWSDGNGDAVRLRSRRIRVAAEDDLVRALRDLLGAESVHYVKAG